VSAQRWPFRLPDRSSSENAADVVCLGHALVDRLTFATPSEINGAGLDLNIMTLVDAARASQLALASDRWQQVAGGSAANTAAGIASLGGRPVFAGAVGDDEPGKWYAGDMAEWGIDCHVATVPSGSPTGLCHVFVTDDGHRSMATHLGAACEVPAEVIVEASLARAQIFYLEGYLLDAEDSLAARTRAYEIAKGEGVVVSLSLSDPFLVERHRDAVSELVYGGTVDLLLGNEDETLYLTGASTVAEAADELRAPGRVAVITRGAQGALAVLPDGDVSVEATPVEHVVDTTGAGDLFAAGLLFALSRGASPEQALRVGTYAAGEVISHLGARPAVSLAAAAAPGLLEF
jgi:sugar/nucleoside kinase (ribokinase family)